MLVVVGGGLRLLLQLGGVLLLLVGKGQSHTKPGVQGGTTVSTITNRDTTATTASIESYAGVLSNRALGSRIQGVPAKWILLHLEFCHLPTTTTASIKNTAKPSRQR